MFTKTVDMFKILNIVVIFLASLSLAHGNHDNATETRKPVRFTLSHGPPPAKVTTRAGQAQQAWFYPLLDHWEQNDQTRWPMRYYYNLQYAKPGGPIFIYVGGEWSIDPYSIEGGQIWDMARENGGSLWYTEHRFYGKSMPKPDFSINSLRYLHSAQAIRDNMEFIQWLKNSPSYHDSKVVLMGCSYSASLITWAKELYPDDIFASYASSGPLLAVDNFYQYFEVVGSVIKRQNEKCWNAIRNGVNQLEKSYTEDGGVTARQMFSACQISEPNAPLDKAVFFNNIANNFAGVVQYAQVGDIDATCNSLMSRNGKSDAEKLANFIKRDLKSGECVSMDYSAQVNYYRNIKSERQWLYQTCNEFGFFQTSKSASNQPFGKSFSETTFNHQLCYDAFTTGFTDNYIMHAQQTTNEWYGGLRPRISNVVSVHGTNDPWTPIGLQRSIGDSAPLYMVQGASHCADLSSVSASDSKYLKDAKNGVRRQIKAWLKG